MQSRQSAPSSSAPRGWPHRGWFCSALLLACSSGATSSFNPDYDAAVDGPDAAPRVDVGLDALSPPGSLCGATPSRLSGISYAPNGTDPIPEVLVYVTPDAQTFEPSPPSVVCQHCVTPSGVIAATRSNPDGSFSLTSSALDGGGVFTVVFEIGGFRHVERHVTVGRCAPMTMARSRTRLPGAAMGDDLVPRIAVAGYRTAPTGHTTVDVNDRFTHVLDAIGITGYDTVDPDRGGSNGGHGQDLIGLLNDPTRLARYQILITPCGVLGVFPVAANLTAAMVTNLRAWLAAGGRLYASDLAYSVIDQAFPGGITFAHGTPSRGDPADIGVGLSGTASLPGAIEDPGLRAWMQHVGAIPAGASTLPLVDLKDPWGAMDSLPDPELSPGARGFISGRVWVSGDVSWHQGPSGPHHHPLTAQAESPGPSGDYCGRVVFTSYHVQSSTGATLSPQERVLEYLFFQLATCIQVPG